MKSLVANAEVKIMLEMVLPMMKPSVVKNLIMSMFLRQKVEKDVAILMKIVL